ncbi:pre-mRNA-splicing regulator female-lethal(2)D-like isoform X1 [Amphibalanus amphitrite]|uniref:pre-mRNA-splicing regulator female-lethal(2)D-like isoform X1 n=1 Tax=Amphibalanus amphitrite TaxID=1232801 RepID=UPI001C9185A5|nr:pre-mRNA-splicing regulator female-lethal(2)D-like isoform X1 [Amphibalanus amphitrite]
MLMNMGDDGNDVKRVVISEDDLMSINKEALLKIWKRQEKYITSLEQKHLAEVKDLEAKLQTALHDSQRKEDLMVMRLNAKEQELQDYMNQISEMKSSSANSAVRNLLLDPAVNFIIEKLKRELCDTKAKLEETQSELSAWKFTPDSQTGKRLMAKCRLLHQENEELGKVVASGKLAKLETDLALQRNLTEEMKKAQSEMDELVQELDEDMEGMQSTILHLQQQLREAKAQAAAAPSSNGVSAQPADDASASAGALNGHAEPEAEPDGEQPEPEPEPVKEPAAEPEPRTAVTAGGSPPEPAPPPDKPEPPAAAEPEPADRTSPEPTGRRRRRRAEQPETGASPEPGRTKRRAAAAAEDSPGRRAKRTRSSDDGGAPAASAD